MNRQSPFLSPIGCLAGGLLIAGILAAVALTGGEIFSPGPLTARAAAGQPLQGFRSHAEFGADCRLCHAPLQGVAADRCLACHTRVGEQMAAGEGAHGHLMPEQAGRCADCHRDHRGPDFSPAAEAVLKFDHAGTGFQLTRHVVDYAGAPLACAACHRQPGFEFLPARCGECHAAADAAFQQDHRAAFGEACLACHDGVDRTHGFDHDQARFPLQGRHAGLACAQCHTAGQPPAEAPAECSACHQPPASHGGVFDSQCQSCHTPADWSPAALPGRPDFQHAATAFQLVHHSQDYAGQPLTCASCHSLPDFAVRGQACQDCHASHDAAFMAAHLQAYGADCTNCHDGAGNMSNFDHNRVFALDGRHAAAACAACHRDGVFRGTPRECSACHAEPQAHAGVFGLKCAACHTTAAWSPAQLKEHAFPLDHGGQGEVPCATCHLSRYDAYTCYGCHEHNPAKVQDDHREVALGGQLLQDCAACHPTGRGHGDD